MQLRQCEILCCDTIKEHQYAYFPSAVSISYLLEEEEIVDPELLVVPQKILNICIQRIGILRIWHCYAIVFLIFSKAHHAIFLCYSLQDKKSFPNIQIHENIHTLALCKMTKWSSLLVLILLIQLTQPFKKQNSSFCLFQFHIIVFILFLLLSHLPLWEYPKYLTRIWIEPDQANFSNYFYGNFVRFHGTGQLKYLYMESLQSHENHPFRCHRFVRHKFIKYT